MPTRRVGFFPDLHCGHRSGLTPPDWWSAITRVRLGKWGPIQRECWRWFRREVRRIKPIYLAVWPGDMIEGTGHRSGGTELIVNDRYEQCEMAERVVKEVGAAHNCFVRGCLTPGHRILTTDLRWVPVETLVAGDKIVGFDANSPSKGLPRCWHEATVLANAPVRKRVYDIILSDGTRLTATGDHPFLVRAKRAPRWATVLQLRSWLYNLDGKRRLRAAPLEFFRTFQVWACDDTRRGGYLAGFFDGEGHCSYGRRQRKARNGREEFVFRIGADQLDNTMLHRVVAYLEEDNWNFSVGNKSRDGGKRVSVLGFITDKLHFLGRIRPHRLLEKIQWDAMGEVRAGRHDTTHILDICPVGEREVCGLSTSTGTYVSEGFLSHNTPYHVGEEEDWEDFIAQKFGERCHDHEWPEVNGVMFDVKHHIGGSQVPYGRITPLAKDEVWSTLWAEAGYQPKGDVLIRAHTHAHEGRMHFIGAKQVFAFVLPALQAMGTKFGARRMSGLVDYGFMHFDIDSQGRFPWPQSHIAFIKSQVAHARKY